MSARVRAHAGDFERDQASGLLLPRDARRGLVRRHPQFFTCGPSFFGAAAGETESKFDSASKGSSVTLSGSPLQKTALCWSSSGARTDQARTSGRRCFGVKLAAINSPETYFAGLSAISGWGGTYTAGNNYLWYGAGSGLYRYPGGAAITVTSPPGNPSIANDVMYFDVNLGAGTMAMKLNAGAWSGAATLTGFTVGASYAIGVFAPSSGASTIQYTVLTTATELGANVPSGAVPWDNF